MEAHRGLIAEAPGTGLSPGDGGMPPTGPSTGPNDGDGGAMSALSSGDRGGTPTMSAAKSDEEFATAKGDGPSCGGSLLEAAAASCTAAANTALGAPLPALISLDKPPELPASSASGKAASASCSRTEGYLARTCGPELNW